MLSEEERKRIDEELKHAYSRRSVVIEALRIVQGERGWVSDEAIKDIAGYLEMTRDEVDSVATFYNMIFRKPVGRHVIYLCESISCWVMGHELIRKHIEEHLGIKAGETTTDGAFTLMPVDCLGACDRAPMMIVDKKIYEKLDPDGVDQVLNEIRDSGDAQGKG